MADEEEEELTCVSCEERLGSLMRTPGGNMMFVCRECKEAFGFTEPRCPCCGELVNFTETGSWKCSSCKCDGDPSRIVWK